MHNTQLIQLLKVLSTQECAQFNAYLNKQKNASNKQELQLFTRLKKYAPNYNSPKMERSKIAQYLSLPNDKWVQPLNKIVFNLKHTLQDFLVYTTVENTPTLKQQLLVKALKKRNHPAYAKHSKQLIKRIESATDKDIDYLTLFQLNYALSADPNTAKIGSELQELNVANQYLDQFYFYHKLKIILERTIAEKINNASWVIDQEVDLLSIVERHKALKESLIIQLLVMAIQVIKTSKKENYLRLKAYLFREVTQLPKKDAQDFFMTLTFHYNQQLSKDFSFYIQEGFDLYKFADQHDLLTVNGRMRDLEYTNAASVGFSTKNEKWTQEFIKRNKASLAPNIRDALYAYVQSIDHFKKGAFGSVIELLRFYNNVPDLALNTNILIRSLLLRANFELCQQENFPIHHQETLYSLSRSFERFLKSKKKLSPKRIEPYILFLHFFNRLIKLIPVSDMLKLHVLQIDIAKATPVALKPWLLSKLENNLSQKELG